MKTFVKPGNEINFVASGTIAGGEVVILGQLVGVLAKSVVAGEVGVIEINGVHQLPKATGVQIAQGERLYFDNTAKRVTNVATANTFIGYADSPEIAAAVTVRVILARPGS